MTQQQVSALRPSSVVTDIVASRLNLRWDLCVMRELQNGKTTDEAGDQWERTVGARQDEQRSDTRRQTGIKEYGED